MSFLPLPDLDEMRKDMRDAYDDESWDAPDETVRALWCDIFEISPDHPEFADFPAYVA